MQVIIYNMKDLEYHIRHFKAGDLNALVEIFDQNTPVYFDPAERIDFLNYLNHHRKTYYVVIAGKKIVAAGGYHITSDKIAGRISWDMVHPAFKHRGLGSAIVQHCIYRLRNTPGIEQLVVYTSQFAFDFYGKFGFKIKEIKKDHWAPGLDLYRMEMPV